MGSRVAGRNPDRYQRNPSDSDVNVQKPLSRAHVKALRVKCGQGTVDGVIYPVDGKR